MLSRVSAFLLLVIGHGLQVAGVWLLLRFIETRVDALFCGAFAAVGVATAILIPIWLNIILFGMRRSWIGAHYPRPIPAAIRAVAPVHDTIRIMNRFRTNIPFVAWRVGGDGFAVSIPVVGEFVIPWSEVDFVNVVTGTWPIEVIHKGIEINSPIYCPNRIGPVIAEEYSTWLQRRVNGTGGKGVRNQ
jgi:hypothetical protein